MYQLCSDLDSETGLSVKALSYGNDTDIFIFISELFQCRFSVMFISTEVFAFAVCAAFAPGHCYEPFVKYGNFTSSDNSYTVGAVVEFSCDPGYTLEQGSVIIECMDPKNPQWNETEPACRGVCGVFVCVGIKRVSCGADCNKQLVMDSISRPTMCSNEWNRSF